VKRGVTLVELMATVVLLGVLCAFTSVAVASLRPGETLTPFGVLQKTRARAIQTGRPALWEQLDQRVLFLPDGSSGGGSVVIAGRTVVIDPLTGEIDAIR
jgi:prepilin-type N-terminal cleavage/methylation domain-containing protein